MILTLKSAKPKNVFAVVLFSVNAQLWPAGAGQHIDFCAFHFQAYNKSHKTNCEITTLFYLVKLIEIFMYVIRPVRAF